MTSILNEVRKLDAARKRGDISEMDFAEIRAQLLGAIEDAEIIEDTAPEPTPAVPNVDLWLIGLLLTCAFFMVTALATWALGDFVLAVTLSVTLLAAIIVRAMHNSENGLLNARTPGDE